MTHIRQSHDRRSFAALDPAYFLPTIVLESRATVSRTKVIVRLVSWHSVGALV